jgi:hypothetical protein
MRILGTAIIGAALALPLALPTGPAHAQNLLGQAQRLLGNGDNNNSEAQQRAYEQGREDQARQQQQRWRDQHADQAYSGQRYGESGRQPAEGYGENYNARPYQGGNSASGYQGNGPAYQGNSNYPPPRD